MQILVPGVLWNDLPIQMFSESGRVGYQKILAAAGQACKRAGQTWRMPGERQEHDAAIIEQIHFTSDLNH